MIRGLSGVEIMLISETAAKLWLRIDDPDTAQDVVISMLLPSDPGVRGFGVPSGVETPLYEQCGKEGNFGGG